MTKIQVKLEDGTLSNFTAFAVDNGNGIVKEFSNYGRAKAYIQQIDQELLKDFMVKHIYGGNIYKTKDALPLEFIAWYCNLGVFDKTEFIKLLQKVVKIDE